jgi:hypothetical protein
MHIMGRGRGPSCFLAVRRSRGSSALSSWGTRRQFRTRSRGVVSPVRVKGLRKIWACWAPRLERVLFIGTQFSILYTSMYSPAVLSPVSLRLATLHQPESRYREAITALAVVTETTIILRQPRDAIMMILNLQPASELHAIAPNHWHDELPVCQ